MHMSVTEQLSTAALALLVVAATMTGTVALFGGVAAQEGASVDLQDPIPEDSTEFDVEISGLSNDGSTPTPTFQEDSSVCLIVRKEETEGPYARYDDLSEDQTVTVDVDEIGGISQGDSVLARIYSGGCEYRIDTDRTTVNEAGFFIDINSTNSPVDEGETLEVEARIENTGAQIDSQDIVMTVAGIEEDRKTVSLDGQAAINETFTWETEPGDAGEYTIALSSEDDEATTDAQVEEQAEFAVTIDSTNSPVAEGETLEVTATVENTDDFEDTQEVVLNIDGNRTDSTNLTLDGGESETVTLEWPTGDSDLGNHTAEVASETDADETDVRVRQPAAFAVTIDSTNSPVAEGETLEVTATVENEGEDSGGGEVSLSIDGGQTDSIDVLLEGGESETVTLEWPTGEGDAGDYSAEVTAGNGSDSAAVTVTSAPTPIGGDGDGNATFEVNITEVRPPDGSGGSLEVDATVENTGDRSDTQNVSLIVDGEETDSQELTLDGGESESVTFSSPSAPEETERLGVRVASQDDADESTVEFDETDSDDGLFPGNSGIILLLLLLLLLLVAYYYYRRRRYQSDRVPVSGGDGEDASGDGEGGGGSGDGEGGAGNGDGDDSG
jgi:hypothetical protein